MGQICTFSLLSVPFLLKKWHVPRATLSAFVHLKLQVLFIYRLSLVPGIRNASFQQGLGSIVKYTSAALLQLSGVADFCMGWFRSSSSVFSLHDLLSD